MAIGKRNNSGFTSVKLQLQDENPYGPPLSQKNLYTARAINESKILNVTGSLWKKIRRSFAPPPPPPSPTIKKWKSENLNRIQSPRTLRTSEKRSTPTFEKVNNKSALFYLLKKFGDAN